VTLVVPDGYTVKYYHSRFIGLDGHPSPKGGGTTAHIIDSNGDVVSIGKSICSKKDAFNRKMGRTIALGRAIKQMKLTSL
jgi:hypothetical protein